MLCAGRLFAHFNNTTQLRVKAVRTVGLIKPVESVGPAGDEFKRTEFTKLVVNSVNVEAAHQRKFSDVSLIPRRAEKQP